MPKVRDAVRNFFEIEPFTGTNKLQWFLIFLGVNPDEAVAIGAAIQGSLINNSGLIPGIKYFKWLLIF